MQDKNTKQLANAIIIAGILIAGAILLKGGVPNKVQDLEEIKIRPISAEEHIIGNKEANVNIITYSDTECPFSKRFQTTINNIVATKPNDVAFVYRHFPLDCVDSPNPNECRTLHAKARVEAMATECAWEQGGNDAFWNYTNELFARTPSNDGLEETQLEEIAKDLRLNQNALKSCISSRKYANKIKTDAEGGRESGATGTPFSLIVTKKDISKKQISEITKMLTEQKFPVEGGPITFYKNKNILSMNGALPEEMVTKIIDILK